MFSLLCSDSLLQLFPPWGWPAIPAGGLECTFHWSSSFPGHGWRLFKLCKEPYSPLWVSSYHHLPFILKIWHFMCFLMQVNWRVLESLAGGILGLALSMLSAWRLWVTLAHTSEGGHWLCFPKMIHFILWTWRWTVDFSEGTSKSQSWLASGWECQITVVCLGLSPMSD